MSIVTRLKKEHGLVDDISSTDMPLDMENLDTEDNNGPQNEDERRAEKIRDQKNDQLALVLMVVFLAVIVSLIIVNSTEIHDTHLSKNSSRSKNNTNYKCDLNLEDDL